jgi:hypothetical protein
MFKKYYSSLKNISSKYNEIFEPTISCIESFYDKYIVFDLKDKNSDNIYLRIEEYNDNGLFGTNLFATSRPIGSINLIKYDLEKKLDIDWFMINNNIFGSTHNYMYGNPIDSLNELEIKRIMFGLAENIAIENNYDIISLDVHSNLKFYKAYGLEKLGFKITKKRAEDNLFWIVTEKNLKNLKT